MTTKDMQDAVHGFDPTDSDAGIYDAEGEDWDGAECDLYVWRMVDAPGEWIGRIVDDGGSYWYRVTADDADTALDALADEFEETIERVRRRDRDLVMERIMDRRLSRELDQLRVMLDGAEIIDQEPSVRDRNHRDCTDTGVDLDIYRCEDGSHIVVATDVSRWQGSVNERGWMTLGDLPDDLEWLRESWESRQETGDDGDWTIVERYTVR